MTVPVDKPKATTLATGPSMALVLLGRDMEVRVEETLKSVGLSLRRLGVLGHLSREPNISFSTLARRAGITVQSMHPIVDGLREAGLVDASGGVEQGRAAAFQLTAQGLYTLEEALDLVKQLDREVFVNGDWADLGEALQQVTVVALENARAKRNF